MKPSKVELKRLARHAEILLVARQCFKEKGLHNTSVSYIAEKSGLSVGQLYRIFECKEEIIEGIVTEIISAKVEKLIAENHNLDAKATNLAGLNDDLAASRQDDYLLMEINAESHRNPRLGEILRNADKRLKIEGGKLIRKNHPNLNEEEINAASELIAVITEGTVYRQGIHENFSCKAELEQLYKKIFRTLFNKNG